MPALSRTAVVGPEVASDLQATVRSEIAAARTAAVRGELARFCIGVSSPVPDDVGIVGRG